MTYVEAYSPQEPGKKANAQRGDGSGGERRKKSNRANGGKGDVQTGKKSCANDGKEVARTAESAEEKQPCARHDLKDTENDPHRLSRQFSQKLSAQKAADRDAERRRNQHGKIVYPAHGI